MHLWAFLTARLSISGVQHYVDKIPCALRRTLPSGGFKTILSGKSRHFSLMNMNITVNQPAQPSPAQPASQPRLQAVDLPPSNASKTIEKIIAFPKSLPTKIDASRFSGTEHFFAGAPLISLQKSNVAFSTPIRSTPMPRSIRCSKRIEIYSALQNVCKLKSTHRGFRGPNNVL